MLIHYQPEKFDYDHVFETVETIFATIFDREMEENEYTVITDIWDTFCISKLGLCITWNDQTNKCNHPHHQYITTCVHCLELTNDEYVDIILKGFTWLIS